MGGSDQLHIPAALSPGKALPVPFGYEVGWAPEQVWTRRRGENNSNNDIRISRIS